MKTKLLILFILLSGRIFSQNDTVIFTTLGNFYHNVFTFDADYSPLIDRMGRPYVYTASTHMGVIVYDISNTMAPVPVDTITPAMMNNEYGSFCAQVNYNLFIATGNLQAQGQRAGLSIYDVTTPSAPVLLSHWDSAAFTNGSSHVIIDGNYAYLAALDDGIIILDISNVNNIQFCSQLNMTSLPCLNNNHARGLSLSGDTLLVANDCGGLRVVNVANRYAPVEIGSYRNPAYGSGIPYYNHVERIGDLAYIPVDYCGFEVDNVAVPSAITNESMWNPINCNSGNWNGSDIHGNEIVSLLPAQNALMISGGDSEVLAFDLSNPVQPRLMGAWGPPNDSVGSWGIDVFGGLVAIGTIKTPFPFYSEHGGLQLLNWNFVLGSNEQEFATGPLKIFPNPTSSICTIALPQTNDAEFTFDIVDVMGRILKTKIVNANIIGRNIEIDLSELPTGIYIIRAQSANALCEGKVVKK